MTRTTKIDLLHYKNLINNVLEHRNIPWRIRVEWAYGKPRVMMYDLAGNQLKGLSPRLPTGQLKTWLDAYLRGLSDATERKG